MSPFLKIPLPEAKPLDLSLTRTEKNCLALACRGMRDAAIGTRLGMSETEVASLMFCAERKLGAANRLHAISVALVRGLVPVDDET